MSNNTTTITSVANSFCPIFTVGSYSTILSIDCWSICHRGRGLVFGRVGPSDWLPQGWCRLRQMKVVGMDSQIRYKPGKIAPTRPYRVICTCDGPL